MSESNGKAAHQLILTVGLPKSGKSTYARQFWNQVPIVCPDEIRLALHGQRFVAAAEPFVWAIAHVMVEALFRAGHPQVVLDATNTTRKRRAEWLSDRWQTSVRVIDTPAAVCLERARREGDDEIVPIIERMAEQYEPPDEFSASVGA